MTDSADQSARMGPIILDEVALCAEVTALDVERVRDLAEFSRERGDSFVRLLVERADVEEKVLLEGLAERLEMPYAREVPARIPDEIVSQCSAAIAIRHHVIPLREAEGRLHVACSDPFDWELWDELEHVLGRSLQRVLCPRAVIDGLLKSHYGLGADTVERLVSSREEESSVQLLSRTTTDLSEEEAANEPTVVNLVNKILSEAIRSGASDIHFEPSEGKYRVRYRIDGMLEDIAIPVSVHLLKLALVSRIKIMSNLDITEKRLPQDGRCQVSLGGQEYDLRISILPGFHGEGVVIRLQSRQVVRLDLKALGFQTGEEQKTSQLLSRPHGLLLVTGPTGSGKTTTLYTCLSMINKPETKIISIEDPIEYWMDDVLQMQVHEEIGFTFARALRGMLRHDPDVMLVGEIRDEETADIAIRSALTGHLVFATLHTNDAASGVTRLLDIGIEPFLLASSLNGIIAQRLVRILCKFCKRKVDSRDFTDLERKALREVKNLTSWDLSNSERCSKCRFSGYRGRTVISEVLLVSPSIKQLIQEGRPAEEIKKVSYEEGMRTLRESGLSTVASGTTDIPEVMRVTQEDF